MMPRLSAACLAFVLLVMCPVRISSRSYSNGLIFYELSSHTPYLPPTVSVSRGRNLASVKYSEKGSIWSTFGQPCDCNGPMCSCCAGLKVDQYGFDQKVCANVSFVPQLEEARLEVFLNDKPSSKYGISVRNPAPFCIPVMMGVPMAMCVQMTDVAVVGSNLNMCMDFVVRMATTDLFEMHFQCMRMGTDGLQYVDKNGKPVLPQGQQSDDPEEYAEYAELEDQPEYTSQEEDYLAIKPEEHQPEKSPAVVDEPVGYPQLQHPAQIIEQLKNHTEKIPAQSIDQLQQDQEPVGYQPLVIVEELPMEPQKLEDQRPQEDPEDPEPLPIESEMLMAGEQSEDSATEDTEATEEATEDTQETEAHTEKEKEKDQEKEKEKEVGTGTELGAEAPDNDHDNDNDNDNGSESGSKPQVIETITNSIKATEAPTTTTAGEEEDTEPEAEAEAEDDDEGGETTTLAVEMENDSDNEINVDDDNDDYEDKLQVKEPPKQQDDNQEEDDEEEAEDDGEEDDEDEEEEYEGEEAAEETEDAALPAVKSQRRHRRRHNRSAHPRRLGKLH
ncbi:glutamic acid-rich protein [Drosophila serrata]|uniref:glutamic acid-rich protein n=1 Tax=Drosophila serrata TaxID=7274 RepID=UPI000A1D274F|nr:glutamic acid-rich protein [Drosophila serrata]